MCPAPFDAVPADAGIEVVPTGARTSGMNSIVERRVRACRRELLDRILIWNQRHLLHALREFETFYHSHRPHQSTANARPLNPLPAPIADPDELARLGMRRSDRLGGVLHASEHAA
ncbi:integrase core domain-containing protein [Streptomyces sp. NWU339]|uniref:integrase core domain-containing protein n=1 Tax=Streptomyces sp. NWU339 TaxID=2185284 RepID=UPI00215B7511|nr:integrase core domain-containing protein [Streptomyces sp. NWU339]